jgi:hypothetical protein
MDQELQKNLLAFSRGDGVAHARLLAYASQPEAWDGFMTLLAATGSDTERQLLLHLLQRKARSDLATVPLAQRFSLCERVCAQLTTLLSNAGSTSHATEAAAAQLLVITLLHTTPQHVESFISTMLLPSLASSVLEMFFLFLAQFIMTYDLNSLRPVSLELHATAACRRVLPASLLRHVGRTH